MGFAHNSTRVSLAAALNTVVTVSIVVICGCGESTAPTTITPPRQMSTVPASSALKPGEALPNIAVEGWLNGPPPDPTSPGTKLVVCDVWALWCPYCRTTAPGLVQLQAKYAPQGVKFMSVTNMEEDVVDSFNKRNKITWPSAYGLTPDGITALGSGSGQPVPGYEIAPIVYLVGSNGRILWTDERSRMRHTDPEKWEKELDDAISNCLKKP